VDSIGQGRVWTGLDALELGLVDELGGMEAAIAKAAEKAGLGDQYKLTTLPEQKDPFQQIMEEMTGKTKTRILEQELGQYYSYIEYLEQVKNMSGIQARLPFYFKMN
jgi:protease-4